MLTEEQPKVYRRPNVHLYCNFHCNSVARTNLSVLPVRPTPSSFHQHHGRSSRKSLTVYMELHWISRLGPDPP